MTKHSDCKITNELLGTPKKFVNKKIRNPNKRLNLQEV